jgi:predicted signal transduction protein with EAL and GGDEF domain
VLDDKRVEGSVSVGIATYPHEGDTRDALLSAADSAMYEAKRKRHQLALPFSGGVA